MIDIKCKGPVRRGIISDLQSIGPVLDCMDKLDQNTVIFVQSLLFVNRLTDYVYPRKVGLLLPNGSVPVYPYNLQLCIIS